MKWVKRHNHWSSSVSAGVIILDVFVGKGLQKSKLSVIISDREGNAEDEDVESVDQGKRRAKEIIAKWISEIAAQLKEDNKQ